MESSRQTPPEQKMQEHVLPSTSTPVVSSDALMQGANELRIVHRGDVYRLRVTRSGKLILQK